MSDNICPNCNNEIGKDSKFCPKCGFSLDNQKNDADEIINNFINFKDDITSKIQNKLENEDIINTNDIKEMIKNLDEDSLKQLMEKHGISPNRFKLLNFNKLLDKVDINRLKDDLIELGIINPKHDSDDVETVKAKIIIEDEDVEEEPQENKVPLIETGNIGTESNEKENGEKEEEIQNDEQTVSPEEEIDGESQEETVVEDDNSEDEEMETSDEEEPQEDKESESVEEENDATEEEPSSNSNICSECGFENRPNVKFCTKCGNKFI